MLLKFIGKDGSMSLRLGKVYDVKLCESWNRIRVEVDINESSNRPRIVRCLYESPSSFAANWSSPSR